MKPITKSRTESIDLKRCYNGDYTRPCQRLFSIIWFVLAADPLAKAKLQLHCCFLPMSNTLLRSYFCVFGGTSAFF
jgi:hypothetical protein